MKIMRQTFFLETLTPNIIYVQFTLRVHFQEVGEDSKLTRSFERIRSIVSKKRARKDQLEARGGGKFEIAVQEMMCRRQVDGRPDSEAKEQFRETVLGYDTPKFEEKPSESFFSPDQPSFGLEPRFSSASQELSKQLQEVLDEKMKSLHSSRDRLLCRDEYDMAEGESRGSPAPGPDEARTPHFSPGCDTCFRYSPGLPPSSPAETTRGSYAPRPSDNQLTFVTSSDSNSCSPNDNKFRKSSNNAVSDKNNLVSIDVASFQLDNQSRSPDGSVRSEANSRDGKRSPESEKEANGIRGRRKIAAHRRVSERRSSRASGRSAGYADSSTSESEPVYSPPSRSSLSTTDKRYSAVFSPPSDTNFSFSLPIDKIYESTFSPPTVTDSSFGPKLPDANKTPSPNDTVASTPTDKKSSPEENPRSGPSPDGPRGDREKLGTSRPPSSNFLGKTEVALCARDKRLSYFLAIEQGESKGNE